MATCAVDGSTRSAPSGIRLAQSPTAKSALLALREQIGSHDHLAGAVQFQAAVGEVVGRSNTRGPDFESGGDSLTAIKQVALGIGSDDLRSRTHVHAEGAQLRCGQK